MISAVDTNILIDILEPDPTYGPASKEALKRSLLEGSVVACEVVWAEVAVAYGHALTLSDRLLTRDKGFYRTYFKKLRIQSP